MKTDNDQYFVYIPHIKVKEFLAYIGDCPFEEYKYKWDYKEYKNKPANDHTGLENEFIELFKQGLSYYGIAKIYNIEPSAVKYYLVKNKLYEVNKNEQR